jgi:hypothetical protein
MDFSPAVCYPDAETEQSWKESRTFMISKKRVIVSNGARLLRELFHHAIDKVDHLEVVQDVADSRDLPQAIARFDPQWVIISTPFRVDSHSWTQQYPSVGFLFLSPLENRIQLKWQGSYQEYADLSLSDFIDILERTGCQPDQPGKDRNNVRQGSVPEHKSPER